ncbi:unnamed protein product [Linum trigynum]|uniref:Zinc knuckle CX2CX4HX4C domain-containing protein n=1 Tax=Linum trigynum TaxID=586398 RepID=A0AAV2EC45_9ROSI
MEINNSRAPSRAIEEIRLTSSSSRNRGDHPILTSTGGRGISMMWGKMLSENRVALAKAAGAACYAWGGYGEVNVQPTETQNLFIFTFSNEEIREMIWRDRQWSLSNTLTAVEKYNGRGKPEEVPIEKVAMWVQIHRMHQNQRSEQNMVAIGTHYFPGLLDLDRASLEFSGYRKFLRILVEVDLKDPVPIGFDFPFIDESTGVDHCDVIDFKYERLVELCYFCGRIGHNWPTCWRMNEERKRNRVAHLSEIYNSSLKAGIDSPHMHQAANYRNSREGEGSQRSSTGRETARSGTQSRLRAEEGRTLSIPVGRSYEGNLQIPLGFTVRRVEQEIKGEEEQVSQGRWRGRYQEEMGSTNLNVELDRAAVTMEMGKRLEEERIVFDLGRPTVEVETDLSLGPTHQSFPAQSQFHAALNEVAEYRHLQDGSEEVAGRKQKKRKGMGLVGGERPRAEFSEDEALHLGPVGGFEMGGLGEGTRKRNLKGKYLHPSTSKGKHPEIEQEGRGMKNKAAVVREKPPLQK